MLTPEPLPDQSLAALSAEPTNSHDQPYQPKLATEHLWKIAGANQDAIRLADAKAAAIFTANFGIATVLGSFSSAAHPIFSRWPHFTEGVLIAAGIFCTVSAGYCLRAFYPALKTNNPGSPLFFKDIVSRYTLASFESEAPKILGSHEQLTPYLCAQVWHTSEICDCKFQRVQRAILWLLPAVFIAIIAIGAANWPLAK